MYRRLRRSYCRWVMVLALVLRLLTDQTVLLPLAQAMDGLRTDPDFIRAMAYLGGGTRLPPDIDIRHTDTKQPGIVTLVLRREQEAVPPALTLPEPFDFAAVDASTIGITGSCTYDYDKQALLAKPIAAEPSSDGPRVLIVHTHGSEAYADEPDFRSEDLSRNVNRVGDAMAEVLNEAGIQCLHITGCNDADGLPGAYDRMADTIRDALEANPSIGMVIDVHRDAYDNADGSPAGPTCTVDGGEAARLMLVMGSDEGGLWHPDWQDNLSCALKLQALLNDQAPGICRDMLLRQSRYNQHFTPCSVLVEVGAAGNTLDEAVLAGQEFARAVVRLLEQAENCA